jgi:hypothetical protein
VIISTGSRATVEPIPGLPEANPLTHIEALDLDHIPGHLLVIGGGYVGLELAQAMCRFGSRVTIIERNARLAHREDQDVTDVLQDVFRDEGIEVVTSARITKVEGKSGESVKLYAARNGSETALEGTDLLVATGRTANTQGIGLELAGVEITDRGYVKVNERLETTAPGVWAVGDCAGSPHFTHIAFDDFVFSHGWPLSADDWDPQMLFFLFKGYRVIAHDRRRHGRSTQVADGHDLDHYADDLKAVTDHLNLRDAIHVGHSTGGGEVVRYPARHGDKNVAKAGDHQRRTATDGEDLGQSARPA